VVAGEFALQPYMRPRPGNRPPLDFAPYKATKGRHPTKPGVGRALTDAGGGYRFITIQPGAYPWGNHHNAWRPAHIHFSLFGRAFTQRLVTQMFFPGDPLLPYDPICNSVPDEQARQRMIAEFSLADTQPEWALAYRFDIMLRGREQSVFEEPHA
jgi:protocatechuate 3,4-dioxygenase, beta subunit